jgi:hypothetical protein
MFSTGTREQPPKLSDSLLNSPDLVNRLVATGTQHHFELWRREASEKAASLTPPPEYSPLLIELGKIARIKRLTAHQRQATLLTIKAN